MSPERAAAEAPPRPGGLEGRLAFFFLHAFAPRVPRVAPVDPPAHLAPFERFDAPHALRPEPLHATWYPATGVARGAVLLAHPWLRFGQAYFHRYGRIPALRAAGYHVLTFDLPGFGGSSKVRGFWDADVEQMLDVLARRAPGLPWHYWGVSSGGVWGHVLLARRDGFAGAMFEDVTPHLLEWSWRSAPAGRPAYLFFRTAMRRAYAFLDLRRHAPFLRARSVAHVVGGSDRGIPVADAQRLSGLANAELLLVAAAGHLESIRFAHDDVIGLAIRTFEVATHL